MPTTFTRTAYSLDGQGSYFTQLYQAKYRTSVRIPTATSPFTSAAYALDSQRLNLRFKYEQTISEDTAYLTSRSTTTVGDDGLFRGVYDRSQKPVVTDARPGMVLKRSFMSSQPSFFLAQEL